MTSFKLHHGAAPHDVLIDFPGQAYVSAHIFPDQRRGHEGEFHLRADVVYQTSRGGIEILTPQRETFASVAEARDFVFEVAEVTKSTNVFLRES